MTQKAANLPDRVMFNAGRTAMASGDTDEASAPASLISAVAESVPISGSIRRHTESTCKRNSTPVQSRG